MNSANAIGHPARSRVDAKSSGSKGIQRPPHTESSRPASFYDRVLSAHDGVIDSLRSKKLRLSAGLELRATGLDQDDVADAAGQTDRKAIPIGPPPTIATSASVVPPSDRVSPERIMM